MVVFNYFIYLKYLFYSHTPIAKGGGRQESMKNHLLKKKQV